MCRAPCVVAPCPVVDAILPRLKKIFSLHESLRPRSDSVPVAGPGTKMDVVQTRQCPELKMFINN